MSENVLTVARLDALLRDMEPSARALADLDAKIKTHLAYLAVQETPWPRVQKALWAAGLDEWQQAYWFNEYDKIWALAHPTTPPDDAPHDPRSAPNLPAEGCIPAHKRCAKQNQ